MSRRALFAASLALPLAALAGCSADGPEQAEALAQISDRIRSTFTVGEKRLANLVYKGGQGLEGGRYAVLVDYDLISTMPEIGLFNTALKSGDKSHYNAERYVFVKSSTGWTLD